MVKDSMFKTQLAFNNWKKNYQFGNETPIETFKRVAHALAANEKNPAEWEQRFLNTMVNFDSEGNPIGLKCTTGGRITANIGTSFEKATLMNCFINGPVKNAKISYKRSNFDKSVVYDINIDTLDNPDSLFNIFLTILEQSKTLASEGGWGMDFSWIRPRGSFIKGTGIQHPGVVSYMQIFDAVAECIVKGNNDGYSDKLKNYVDVFRENNKEQLEDIEVILKKQTRKGAMLSVLRCDHPDIEEYVRAKQESGKLTKFNMSVGITDEFMNAVINNHLFPLKFEGKVIKIVSAAKLYELIMKSNYNRGEPGVIFLDNAMKNNPIAYVGKITAANPCGEVVGNGDLTTVCLLGSPNLTQYVGIIDGIPVFNWSQYEEDIKVFTRMLDNVCDLTTLPLPSYEHAVKNFRQFGMGINGLGSTLLMLNIPYNSEEALDFIKKVCSLKENLTWQTSALLAKEKGQFPAYDKEKFCNTEYFLSDRITEETKEMIRMYGVRNAKTTTAPPLGNSSITCDNCSNGIEPIFDIEVERTIVCNKWPEGLTADNVKNVLTEKKQKDYTVWQGEFNGQKYYYEPHNRGLCEIVYIRDYGYQWIIDNKLDHSKSIITTKDLSVDDHLNVQSIVQYYNNQSTSKTVNLPRNYSFEDFENLYIKGWKKGLIGLTSYREGSMESVLNTIQEAEEKKEIIKQNLKLPTTFINGPTEKIKREGVKFYIHFSYLPADNEMKYPIAIWITTNAKQEAVVCNRACKSLTKLALDVGISDKIVEDTWDKALGDLSYNRLARMISLCLRHNIPIADIIVTLTNIEGDNVSTILTAVRKFLGRHVKNGTKAKGIKCGSCGSDDMRMESGCYVCKSCGSQKCG